jgi:hypothetical protein
MTLGFLDRFRPRRDLSPPLVVDGLSQARAYWEGLRDGHLLPERREVDPRGLVGVLDRVFLADRIGRGVARVRIAGSALTDFAGTDVRGLPLGCLFNALSRGQLSDTLEQVFAGPAVGEIDLGSDRMLGGGLVGRLLLLPLDDELGGRLVLGVMGFVDPAPARCKLTILSRREERLMSSPSTAEQPVPQPIRQMGHLSLVHSAD